MKCEPSLSRRPAEGQPPPGLVLPSRELHPCDVADSDGLLMSALVATARKDSPGAVVPPSALLLQKEECLYTSCYCEVR